MHHRKGPLLGLTDWAAHGLAGSNAVCHSTRQNLGANSKGVRYSVIWGFSTRFETRARGLVLMWPPPGIAPAGDAPGDGSSSTASLSGSRSQSTTGSLCRRRRSHRPGVSHAPPRGSGDAAPAWLRPRLEWRHVPPDHSQRMDRVSLVGG